MGSKLPEPPLADTSAEDSPYVADTDAQTILSKLYHDVLREVEDDVALTEISDELYRNVSVFIDTQSRKRYSDVEGSIMEQIISTASQLVSLMLDVRLAKATRFMFYDGDGGGGDHNNNDDNNGGKRDNTTLMMQRLLDEEKFILNSAEEYEERQDIVLSATISGRSKLLESISEKHKTSRILVRFIKDVESMIGVDMEMYGPFKIEDIATIPYENAQALISEDVAVHVRSEDYGGRL